MGAPNTTATPPNPSPRPGSPARRPGPLHALAAIFLLSLLHPLSWPGQTEPPLWVPSAGVGLALVSWFGPRAALLFVPAVLLSALRLQLTGVPLPAGAGWLGWAGAVLEGLFQGAILLVVWSAFRSAVRGELGLRVPRSAILFLVVTGLVVGLFALARSLPVWLLGRDFPFLRDAGAYWVAQLLGILAVAPPLLVFVTPWLARTGRIDRGRWSSRAGAADLPGRTPTTVSRPRRGPAFSVAPPAPAGPSPSSLKFGDWAEIFSLTVATALLTTIFTVTQDPRQTGSWQLWGAPLLLVVWAGLRQGLAGATLVAAAGTASCLVLLTWLWPTVPRPLLLQGNLLAQCCTALLVAASSTWFRQREDRYRRVVRQIPVVLYSARLIPATHEGEPPAIEITFVSPPSEGILGCPPASLLGPHDRWLARVHPEDREIVLAAVNQLARQRDPVVCEYRLDPAVASGQLSVTREEKDRPLTTGHWPLATAKVRWIRDTLVPHLDEEGRLEGWEGMASDITEQRVLSDDLRRTTSMFHALVANLPAGVFFVSARSGRPLLVNQRARQLLGQREDVFSGLDTLPSVYRLFRSDGTLYPADELPVCQALQQGAVCMRDDIVVHRPDGRKVPLITWAAPVDLGQPGKTDAVVWVLEDLTDLRLAEAARRETETRLRTVIESLAEGLLVQNRHEEVIDCNGAARALLGNYLDNPSENGTMFHDEGGQPLAPEQVPMRRVLRSGIPLRNVILGVRAGVSLPAGNGEPPDRPRTSGAFRWVLVNSLPLVPRSKSGPFPAGAVTTLVDISDHMQAHHLLSTSEERYHTFVDSLPLLVAQLDRQRRVTYLNPTGEALTGYRADELRESAVWQGLLHPDDLDRYLAALDRVLTGGTERLETRYRSRDGQQHVCLVFLQPLYRAARLTSSWTGVELRGSGPPSPVSLPHPSLAAADDEEIVGVTLLSVDVTRERRLEEELERARRLELLGRLSSGIAHDFNNLLSVLLGMTEVARHNLGAHHPAQEELQRIYEVGQQASGLAEQILAFSKQRKVPLRRIDLNRSIDRTLKLLHTLLPPGIESETRLETGEVPILGDEIQLQQVLMNLCLNARDAMPGGGRLTIETRVEQDSVYGLRACLTVADTGQGMTEEVRRRIFEPFFTTKERGTGLGLAVVQQIVQAFGGEIRVESEQGRGTRVEVWLPLAD